MNVTDVIGGALLVAGAALALLAGVGVLRFPDVLARMHAATKPATLGVVLLAAGAALIVGSWPVTITLGLVVVLQFLTAPAGAHMIGRAATRAGVGRQALVIDELPRSDDLGGPADPA